MHKWTWKRILRLNTKKLIFSLNEKNKWYKHKHWDKKNAKVDPDVMRIFSLHLGLIWKLHFAETSRRRTTRKDLFHFHFFSSSTFVIFGSRSNHRNVGIKKSSKWRIKSQQRNSIQVVLLLYLCFVILLHLKLVNRLKMVDCSQVSEKLYFC